MSNLQTIIKSSKKKIPVQVTKANYIDGYRIAILFNDGASTEVDFHNFIFSKDGFLKMYQQPENFKKFKIKNGNLVWGKNWDLIFPIEQLYKGYIKN